MAIELSYVNGDLEVFLNNEYVEHQVGTNNTISFLVEKKYYDSNGNKTTWEVEVN